MEQQCPQLVRKTKAWLFTLWRGGGVGGCVGVWHSVAETEEVRSSRKFMGTSVFPPESKTKTVRSLPSRKWAYLRKMFISTNNPARICWEPSSVTLCCNCCPLWQKTNEPISDSGRPRALQRQRPRAFGLGGHPNRCPRISILFTSVGEWEKSPGLQQQRNVECLLLPSVTGQRFTKKPGYCKKVVLQECVPFCKDNMTSFLFGNLWGVLQNSMDNFVDL